MDQKTSKKAFESLPEEIQKFLKNALKDSKTEKEFINKVMVGDCPVCGSPNTRDCEGTPLDDPTVGICLDCYTIGCLECGEIFEKGQTICKHWKICDGCNFSIYSSSDSCGVQIDECSIIQDWKNSK